MNPISNRYMQEEFIISLDKGLLYKGRDLSLQRIVFIYAVPRQDKAFAETYIQKIGSSAQGTSHAPYMHIFDVETDDDYIYVIMKYMEGTTLQNILFNHTWSFRETVDFITGMSQTLMEIAEVRPLNFSINPDNIWVSDEQQITLINTWDKFEHNRRLSMEISGLFYRLLTREEHVPATRTALRNGLQNSSLLYNVPALQKEAVIQAVLQAQEERISTLSFAQSLKELFSLPETNVSSRTEIDYTAEPLERAAEPNVINSTLTPLKKTFLSTLIWKRISLTLSLALLSGAVFIGVFALLIETTGNKKASTLASGSTAPKQQTAPPVQEKTKTAEVPVKKEPVVETASINSGNQVTIPVLTGLTKEAAEKQALASGLRYAYYLETNPQSAGTVFKQEPSPNETAVKGSKVTFWISKGSPSP